MSDISSSFIEKNLLKDYGICIAHRPNASQIIHTEYMNTYKYFILDILIDIIFTID